MFWSFYITFVCFLFLLFFAFFGGGGGGGEGGVLGCFRASEQEIFEVLDVDGGGELSQEEFVRSPVGFPLRFEVGLSCEPEPLNPKP